MRYLLVLANLCCCALAQVPNPTFPLDVVVVDQDGRPLDGVIANVTAAGGFAHQVIAGIDGTLRLELPEGVYDIEFSQVGFYDTVVKSVEIDIVDDLKLRKEKVGPLRVLLQRKLIFEIDLIVLDHDSVAAPPLEVKFEPTPPVQVYSPAKGVVTLTNTGSEPLQIPLGRQFKIELGTLLMRVQVEVQGTELRYSEPFVCVAETCDTLMPGSSVRIPIQLKTRAGYSVGKSELAVYDGPGDFEGTVRVYFALPRERDDERSKYTELVESPFKLTVK